MTNDSGAYHGTPRALPFVLLCQADVNFCGRLWVINKWDEQGEKFAARQTHEVLCSSRAVSAGIISVLGEAEHSGLLVVKR